MTPAPLDTISSLIGFSPSSHVKCKKLISSVQYGDIWRASAILLPPAIRSNAPELAVQLLRVPVNDAFRTPQKQLDREKQLKQKHAQWRKARHENVLRVLGLAFFKDLDGSGPVYGLVTQWMTGGKVMGVVGTATDDFKLKILHDVSKGIEYLHNGCSPSIVHGSVTPENIILDANGIALLTNFGLATLMEDGTLWETSVQRDNPNIRYTAPELLKGARPVPYSTQSDIFGFGMAAYQILTLMRPFEEKSNDAAVGPAIVRGDFPARPHASNCIADELWKILGECWTKEPSDRPGAGRLEHRIRRYIQERAQASVPLLASGVLGNSALIFNTNDDTFEGSFMVDHQIHFIEFSRTRNHVLCSASLKEKTSKRISLVDSKTFEIVWTGTGGGPIAYSTVGLFVCTTDDFSVQVWDSRHSPALKLAQSLSGHKAQVNDVSITSDGLWVASASNDKSVKVWNTSDGTQHGPPDMTCYIERVNFSPSADYLAAMLSTGQVAVWAFNNETLSSPIRLVPQQSPICMSISPDSTKIVIGCEGGMIYRFSLSGAPPTGIQMPDPDGDSYDIKAISYSPDGQHIAVSSDDNNIRIRDASDASKGKKLYPSGNYLSLAFAPTPI